MSAQFQSNRIVPRSILRHRPIASDREQTYARRTASSETLEIPPWHRNPPPSSTKPETFASSVSLATIVGCGMLLTLLLLIVGQFVVNWAQIALDDLQYGRPRTVQIDCYVGHELAGQPPSHFIALNNRGRIEVIELPGDDATRARIFLGPQFTGENADLVPVTIDFLDPHRMHYPDMLVHGGNTSIFFRNTHKTFELQPASG